MCLGSTKDKRGEQDDIALAFMNLSVVRKFAQVCWVLLKGKKLRALLPFHFQNFLVVKATVWWWGKRKVDRIEITRKWYTIHHLPDLFLRTYWKWGRGKKKKDGKRTDKRKGGEGQKPIVRPCLFGQCLEALPWHQLGTITFCFLIEANSPELVTQVKFEEPRALSQRVHRETAS